VINQLGLWLVCQLNPHVPKGVWVEGGNFLALQNTVRDCAETV
jgi:hypothetical protein